MHGFLAVPPGAGPHPTVLIVHGGPHHHDADSWDPEVQAFVDHGYAVGLVNYRGSTGYGKAWQDVLEGDPGRPEIEDVVAGRDDLVARGLADPDQVVISGASWGGYVTLQAIGTVPEGWRAAMAVVPTTCRPTPTSPRPFRPSTAACSAAAPRTSTTSTSSGRPSPTSTGCRRRCC